MGGYHGPPQLTVARAFTEWTVDPWALAFVLLLGGLYLAGARRLRRSGAGWPLGRTVAFCGLGLGFAVIATMSWVGVYAGVLFYVRAVQTVLLLLLIPMFFALGKPISFRYPGGYGLRHGRHPRCQNDPIRSASSVRQ